jgi:hypothetical protein
MRMRRAHALLMTGTKEPVMNKIESIEVVSLASVVGGNGVAPLVGGGLPKPAIPAMYSHPNGQGCSIERGGQGIYAGERYDSQADCSRALAREPMAVYSRGSREWQAHFGGYRPQ